jgi:hypothetical protein
MPNPGSRLGKYERAVKMANIWIVMRNIRELFDTTNHGRSSRSGGLVHLREYQDRLQRILAFLVFKPSQLSGRGDPKNKYRCSGTEEVLTPF